MYAIRSYYADDPANNGGTLVDKSRIDLDQIGTGDKFLPCIIGVLDAAHADNRYLALQLVIKLTNYGGRKRLERASAEATAFLCQQHTRHSRARKRGIGSNDSIELALYRQSGDGCDLIIV